MKNFGDLIMMFRSRNTDYDTVHTTSDFVIKPEHYITLAVRLWLNLATLVVDAEEEKRWP